RIAGRPVHLCHVAGQSQDRRMVTRRFIKAGDKVRAAGTGRAGAYGEATSQFGLPRPGERRSLLMPDADPFDLLWRTASPSGLSESPIRPKICLTPISSSTATKVSATICDICHSFAAASAATLAVSKKIAPAGKRAPASVQGVGA